MAAEEAATAAPLFLAFAVVFGIACCRLRVAFCGERLYFCGSSTHPGAGVPIVLLSAKLAVQELMRDDREERTHAGGAR